MVLVLWIVSILTFTIFVVLPPADPARRLAGKSPTPEAIAEARASLGLDKPWYVQYGRFAKGLVPLPGWFLNREVYFSYGNNVAVADEIKERLPVTIALAVGGMIMWLCIGVPIGVISAVKRGSVADRAAMGFALVGVSAPVFWVGSMLLAIFSTVGLLKWFPPDGIPPGESVWQAIANGRFWLPWITIAVTSAAFYARMVRGNVLESLSEDYIRTARAKGLSERRVIYKHALRSSLTPVVTMVGLDLAGLLGGAIITETVFNLPGIGKYAVDALANTDFPATMAVTVIAALFIVIANLAVDVGYAFLDPRVRYE
jgi:peptide/nickel transport system permease protein